MINLHGVVLILNPWFYIFYFLHLSSWMKIKISFNWSSWIVHFKTIFLLVAAYNIVYRLYLFLCQTQSPSSIATLLHQHDTVNDFTLSDLHLLDALVHHFCVRHIVERNRELRTQTFRRIHGSKPSRETRTRRDQRVFG